MSQEEDPGRAGKNLVQFVLTSVESLKLHWLLDQSTFTDCAVSLYLQNQPQNAKDRCCIMQQNRYPLNCTAVDRTAVLWNPYLLLESLSHLLAFLTSFSVVFMGDQDLVCPNDLEDFQNYCKIVCGGELLRFHFSISQGACFFQMSYRRIQLALSVETMWETLSLNLEIRRRDLWDSEPATLVVPTDYYCTVET